MQKFETMAYIYSLNKEKIDSTKMDWITVLDEIEKNKYKVNYRGVICTAFFNAFNCKFYVDDIYGIIKE